MNSSQSPNDSSTDQETEEWLSFEVAGEHYCQAIAPVKEVLRYDPPVPVPGSPHYVCGITNVRGEVLTVLSAHALLEMDAPPPGEQTRVITFELAGDHYGLLVDSVSEILRFRPETLDYGAPAATDDGNPLLLGTFNSEQGLVIAVDIAGFIEQQLRDNPA